MRRQQHQQLVHGLYSRAKSYRRPRVDNAEQAKSMYSKHWLRSAVRMNQLIPPIEPGMVLCNGCIIFRELPEISMKQTAYWLHLLVY